MPLLIVGSASAFAPVGMLKNGPQQLTQDWAMVVNWTADVARYPGSVVVGDKQEQLRSLGSKTNAKIEVGLPFSGGSTISGMSHQVQFRINGSDIPGVGEIGGNQGTLGLSLNWDVHAGDVITAVVRCIPTLGSTMPTINATANAYLRIS
ncbi:hypothetical protein NDR87_27725 [Nocardia sp. CDC159]|uniref:Uncharacterized protein n=1 Tax=Nocardia pulmonis TaxID=2951408 RepID=A0A9X2EAE3_9NOCA|nr:MULTISPECIES: hypothetical protein [Nocardia]MCM6777282.1 hypothetical protein [Nocardia pulmonis]MCM6790167.1 hypothetical protein [Nocardia sp. CDC159]